MASSRSARTLTPPAVAAAGRGDGPADGAGALPRGRAPGRGSERPGPRRHGERPVGHPRPCRRRRRCAPARPRRVGGARAQRQLYVAVILHHDRGAIHPTTTTQVGAQRESSQRIRLNGNEVCIGKCLACCQDKAAGTGPRIHDTGGLTLRPNPTHHGMNDGRGRVGQAEEEQRRGRNERQEGEPFEVVQAVGRIWLHPEGEGGPRLPLAGEPHGDESDENEQTEDHDHDGNGRARLAARRWLRCAGALPRQRPRGRSPMTLRSDRSASRSGDRPSSAASTSSLC